MKIDKLLHFFFGTWVAFFLINSHIYYGFIAALVVAVGKEVIYDKLMKKGTFDWWDMFWTAVPAVLIFLTRYNTF